MTIAARPARIAVTSWVIYDLANTIFSMGIVSLFFPHFVEQAVGPTQVDRVFGTIQSCSYAIIFLLSPMLGAMTDRARRRMPFLMWSTVVCVTATALIGRGSFLSSALLFILANATYQAGIQFYDSLLIEVTTPENRGRVSGIGTGLGYVGSYIAVALGILLGESHFTEAAHFWPLFVWIAASFLVLSIPCFLFVRERGNPNPRPVFTASAITSSAAETIATFRSGRQYPGLIRFLVGRVFYTDAINTVIGYMAIYTMHVSRAAGLTDQAAAGQRDLIMLSAITCAIPAGLVWGRFTDSLGPKRTLERGAVHVDVHVRPGGGDWAVQPPRHLPLRRCVPGGHLHVGHVGVRSPVHAATDAATSRRRVLRSVRHGGPLLGHRGTGDLGADDLGVRGKDGPGAAAGRGDCDSRAAGDGDPQLPDPEARL